jgi:hypothetical protein
MVLDWSGLTGYPGFVYRGLNLRQEISVGAANFPFAIVVERYRDTEGAVRGILEYPPTLVSMQAQNTDRGIARPEFESDEGDSGALRRKIEVDMNEGTSDVDALSGETWRPDASRDETEKLEKEGAVYRVLVYEVAHHTPANCKKRMIAPWVSICQRKNGAERIEGHSESMPDPPGSRFLELDLLDGGLMATADCCVHFACTGRLCKNLSSVLFPPRSN